jgi:hypothetical protein
MTTQVQQLEIIESLARARLASESKLITPKMVMKLLPLNYLESLNLLKRYNSIEENKAFDLFLRTECENCNNINDVTKFHDQIMSGETVRVPCGDITCGQMIDVNKDNVFMEFFISTQHADELRKRDSSDGHKPSERIELTSKKWRLLPRKIRQIFFRRYPLKSLS